MPLYSNGLFSGLLRCRDKIVLEIVLTIPAAILPLPPCRPKNRSFSVRQVILLEALSFEWEILKGLIKKSWKWEERGKRDFQLFIIGCTAR